MDENILGKIRVLTLFEPFNILYLCFTIDRVIVVWLTDFNYLNYNRASYWLALTKAQEKEIELEKYQAEELLASNPKNFAIPMSAIIRVTLRKYPVLRARFLTIQTSDKKYRWQAIRVATADKLATLSELVNILKPIFDGKLVLKIPE